MNSSGKMANTIRLSAWPYAVCMLLMTVIVRAGVQACGTSAPLQALDTSPTDLASQYRLGTGDQVRVTVFNQTNLSGEFTLDGTGFIALPLVGPVSGAGKTARELEQAIVETLRRAGYLVNPSVAVQVMQFRPYYILGEVTQPGSYPYTTNLTVRKAVATAHGYTYRANTKRVYIQRAGETEERLYTLTPSSVVLPGDTIRIPERLF